MDDYSLASLTESKNEWCVRLVNTITPAIIEGLKSIFKEAWDLCSESNEEDQYLMTFQTFLSRIPSWNDTIVNTERKRIEEVSNCGYLEELISCVHVVQLKALTCVRVGQTQKKVDIDIPNANQFIHRVYINIARKLYTNIYLFDHDVTALEIQKHNRELEMIIKECILNAVRDTMPIENILRAYIDETEEQDVDIKEDIIVDETNKEPINEDIKDTAANDTDVNDADVNETEDNDILINEDSNIDDNNTDTTNQIVVKTSTVSDNSDMIQDDNSSLQFSNKDHAIDEDGSRSIIDAPKTDERLEEISRIRQEEEENERIEEEKDDALVIGDNISLDIADVNDLNRDVTLNHPTIDNIEVLT